MWDWLPFGEVPACDAEHLGGLKVLEVPGEMGVALMLACGLIAFKKARVASLEAAGVVA